MAVTGSILDFLVPQQHLDDTDILVMFQQVCGKGMPQGMQGNLFFDPCGLASRVERTIELPGRQEMGGSSIILTAYGFYNYHLLCAKTAPYRI